MNVLVLVPFKEEHMARIREAAGPGANVIQYADLWKGRTVPVNVTLYSALNRGGGNEPSELEQLIAQAEVIIGEPHPRLLLDEELPLKWLQITWAGTDLFTFGRFRLNDTIMLTNVAGAAYGHIISQYVVGQILSIAQNFPQYIFQQRTKAWNDLGPVFSLEGANVIIYGAGDIGSHVAKRLAAFDVESITGVCRDTAKPRKWFDKLVSLSQAEFELSKADIVVCCMPSSPATRNYFGARRLRYIKRGGILVNVGRGDFVDCDALDAVLKEGHLRGAALDVTDPEPLPIRSSLWLNSHCNITPHVSGTAFGRCDGTEERICDICCENLRRYVAGEELTHRVQ